MSIIDQNKSKWNSIPNDEKETIINFDYFEECLTIFTTNQMTARKLTKKVGQPSKIDYYQGQITSEEWRIPFKEREHLKKSLSINNFVTFYLSNKEE